MTGSTVRRIAADHFEWSSADGPASVLRRVVEAAEDEDGAAPLDEAALIRLRRHGLEDSALWLSAADGFAWLHGSDLAVVVHPAARGSGIGASLVSHAAPPAGPVAAWSHGNHPAAAALARRFGFERVRDLWVMRRALRDLPALPPTEVEIRAFRVGVDEAPFLAVNAAAFAHHPEQGRMTRADLEDRMAEEWFDPSGFFLAWDADELLGYHWTKEHAGYGHAGYGHAGYGEVYVVGISPSAQGRGLGRLLTLTGLHHLASRGHHEVILYVESDNAAAIATYAGLGFSHAAQDTHVMYARA